MDSFIRVCSTRQPLHQPLVLGVGLHGMIANIGAHGAGLAAPLAAMVDL